MQENQLQHTAWRTVKVALESMFVSASWIVFFLYRKLTIDGLALQEGLSSFQDKNLYLGIVANGILWVLFSGAAWRDLPERYGPWKTVYGRFNRWQKDGTIDKIMAQLQLKMDEEGLLDYSTWMVDSTITRAHKSASGARKKKPKKNP